MVALTVLSLAALFSGADAQFLGGGGMPGGGSDGASDSSDFNCCGGGSGCGFVHCAALGSGQDGCVHTWALPNGMTMDDCAVTTPSSSADISIGCLQYFDGCNTCSRNAPTDPLSCTMMMCFVQGTSSCSTYAPGYGDNDMIKIDDGFDGFGIDPGFGVLPANMGVAAGGSCASGFCEDPSNCPQCASGLTCQAQQGMMCAGTCFGTCVSGGH